MITRLFRNGSVLVRIILVPYKYVPVYMYIVKDTYPFLCTIRKNSLIVRSQEFDL